MAILDTAKLAVPAPEPTHIKSDRRPLRVQVLHGLGIVAAASPVGLIVTAAAASTSKLDFAGMAGAVVIFALATFFAWALLVSVATRANPHFDVSAPDLGEFAKGLVLAPLWVAAYAVLIIVPLMFFGGVLGVALWVARKL